MRIDDKGCSATFVPNGRYSLSLSPRYAITRLVEIVAQPQGPCAVDLPRMRRPEPTVSAMRDVLTMMGYSLVHGKRGFWKSVRSRAEILSQSSFLRWPPEAPLGPVRSQI